MLNQKMVYKKSPLIVFRLSVYPQFIFRNIFITVMLPEVRKFLIYMPAYIRSIDNPNLQIAASPVFFQIRLPHLHPAVFYFRLIIFSHIFAT